MSAGVTCRRQRATYGCSAAGQVEGPTASAEDNADANARPGSAAELSKLNDDARLRKAYAEAVLRNATSPRCRQSRPRCSSCLTLAARSPTSCSSARASRVGHALAGRRR